MDESPAQSPSRGGQSKKLHPGTVVAGKYKLLEKIGAGSFGQVFKTQNLKNGELVAAKFEKREEHSKGISLLMREIKVLSEVSTLKGFPSLRFYGRDEFYNFFMESYLGLNLEQLMRKCGGKFTVNTTLRIGVQLLERMQDFHEKNLIHRDIKPENFTIGITENTIVYAIDFGLAKYYRDNHGKHIPFIGNKGLIGTARYASSNALLGNEQSRRDDLEALAYVLIYFILGELPWQNMQAASKEEKYKQILKMKQDNVLEKSLDPIPKCLTNLLRQSKNYEFVQTPDYDELKKSFMQEIDMDRKLDWEIVFEVGLKGNDLSVSIDLVEQNVDKKEQADQDDDINQNLLNSMLRISQQDHKFISGRLNNSKSNLLEVPKCSLVLDQGGNSPVGTIVSINSSKINNYQKSQNFVSQKHFQYNSTVSGMADDDYVVGDDDEPSLSFQNLVIKRQYSKN